MATKMRRCRWLALTAAVALGIGCADRMVTLRYVPESTSATLANAHAITVFKFSDRRGSEGDNDAYRVGGIYGGYGNRLAKVMTDTPFQATLVRALTAGFQARGIQATGVEDRELAIGVAFKTPLALAGEVRNFSTESRWGTSSHIGGIIRLYDAQGSVLVEKMISERETTGLGSGVFASAEGLEEPMNKALRGFVQKVVTDPDITARLIGGR